MRLDTALALCLCASNLAAIPEAGAHVFQRSFAAVVASETGFDVLFDLDANDLDELLRTRFDADRSGRVDQAEVEAHERALALIMAAGLRLRSGTTACEPELRRTQSANEILRADIHYRCAPREPVEVTMPLLERLRPGHRHFLTVQRGAATATTVLSEKEPVWREQAPEGAVAQAVRFALSGFGHILAGYDHLLFLLALVLFSTAVRDLIKIVSAFTLAHAITLSGAAMGALQLSPNIVEPAIALSIAYVGAENLFLRNGSRRWLMAMALGLVHGFGFAGALAEMQIPADARLLPLVSFNLGLEVGQVLIVVACAMVLRGLTRLGSQRRILRLGSIAIAAAGVGLFVVRVI